MEVVLYLIVSIKSDSKCNSITHIAYISFDKDL